MSDRRTIQASRDDASLFNLNDHDFLQLKVLVKHVIAIAILIPLSVSALPVWIAVGDPASKLFTLFPVLLVLLLFVSPLSKPSVLRFRGLANLLGACLLIASLFLPYSFFGGDPSYVLGPGPISRGAPQLILLGCLLIFFSRFGSIVSVAGLLDYSNASYLCSAFGCPPYTLGSGYWLAWAGILASLLGRSWIALPKSVEGRKLLGSITFPVGLILSIVGFLLLYAGFDQFGPALVLGSVLVIAGFTLIGAGLNLFFRLESTTMSRIRRLLQKPLW